MLVLGRTVGFMYEVARKKMQTKRRLDVRNVPLLVLK